MAEFHWIGSTGNNITKFYWNNINNWAVSTNQGIIRASTYGRLPQGNDTVKIGTDLHCFSPLLYGGYTGGTGSSGQSNLFGNWCQGQTAGDAHGSAGYTAGVTGGGVMMVIATDNLSVSGMDSVSNAISLKLINSTISVNEPNKIFSTENINNAASYSGINPEAFYFQMLQTINPHGSGIATPVQAISNSESSKYPFPYLGGGITGDILRYLKSVWNLSLQGYTAGDINTRADNAWVGGGWTGTDASISAEAKAGLRIRVGGKDSLGTRTAFLLSPGDNATPQNRIFNLDINMVGDKLAGSNQIVSDMKILSRGNPLHSYVFRTGTFRSVISQGDAAMMFEACTAGSIQTDYHNYTSVGPQSRVGGLVIDTENNDPRYHPWVLYFAGGITSGARQVTYGSASTKIDLPWNNKIIANTNPSTYNTNYAKGMAGFTWSTTNPLIGIGEFGGTAGPIYATADSVTGFYTFVPSIEMYSNTRDGTPDWDQTRSDSELGAVTSYSLELLGNCQLGNVLAYGANVYYSSRGSNNATVYMGALRMREGASLDFTRNPDMDALFIGGFTGTGVNTQIVGGILVEDDTCTIRPSKGTQFANSKVVGSDGIGGIDARATLFSPTNNPAFTPSSAVSIDSVRSGDSLFAGTGGLGQIYIPPASN
jgi:hypothetical protein